MPKNSLTTSKRVIRCVKDTVLPLQKPPMKLSGSDKEITGLPVKKGSKVIISVMNANRDKQIWGEDAFDWNPERWLNPLPGNGWESKDARNLFVHVSPSE